MKKPNSKVYRADALMLVTAIIWGSGFVAQRAGMDYMGPFAFNGIRFALGALVLLPLIKYKQCRPDSDPKRAQSLLWGGGIAGGVLFIAATLQQIGLVYTTAGKAGFITGLYVIFVALMACLGGYKPDAGSWVGAVLACAGLYFLSITDSLSFAPGDLWVLTGAIFWAVHVLILSRLSPKLDGMRLACAQFTVCALLSLSVAIIFDYAQFLSPSTSVSYTSRELAS
ncbi:MAG: DMT family transporter, partial [Gammaproteobacteria bacterium]|nr:DMT family transporter [Gammaproteobacteria bacterium]